MDDRFIKYTKLSIIIFLLFLCVPLMFGVLFGVFYGFSAIISSRPIDLLFELFVLSLPATIFCTVYSIFIIRTKNHPVKFVRILSYCCFALGIATSLYYLALDLMKYFKFHNGNISGYNLFETLFLSGNIGMMFTIAMIQAFSMPKEKDWMDKVKERKAVEGN